MLKKKLSLISVLMILILSVNGCGMIPSSTEIETYLKENDIEGKLDRLIDAETESSADTGITNDDQDIKIGQVFEGNDELSLPIKIGYWDVVSDEDYHIFVQDGDTSRNKNDWRRQHNIICIGNEVREFRVSHGDIAATYLGKDSPISNVECISRPDNKYYISYDYFELDFENSFGITLPDEYTEEEYNEYESKIMEVEKLEDHVEVVQFNYKVQEDKPYIYAELPGCTTNNKGNVCISEDYIVKLNPKEENLYEVKYRPAYYDFGQNIHIYSSEFDIDHLTDDKLYMLHQWDVNDYEEILDQKEYDTRIVPLIEKYVKTNKE